MKIKVLIADDHAMMLAGIRAVLSTRSNIDIVGEALDGEEVLEKTKALLPDIVIMDVSMPPEKNVGGRKGREGFDAARQLRREMPQTKIIIHSMHRDREYVEEFLQIGASAYVVKNSSPDELLRAIEAVYRGEAYFSSCVSQLILEQSRMAQSMLPDDLTEREVEVIVLLSLGLRTKEIADKLHRSSATISKHLENIKKKTNCHSTALLTQYAIKHNFL
jgi:DNA-binding NarL/FixJ family response regulator